MFTPNERFKSYMAYCDVVENAVLRSSPNRIQHDHFFPNVRHKNFVIILADTVEAINQFGEFDTKSDDMVCQTVEIEAVTGKVGKLAPVVHHPFRAEFLVQFVEFRVVVRLQLLWYMRHLNIQQFFTLETNNGTEFTALF